MLGGNVSVKVSRDKLADVLKALGELSKKDVLVGIPQEESGRAGTVTNAELLYIHTNGSPINNIPARPVIEPAIEKDKNNITTLLKDATKKALDGDSAGSMKSLELAGMEGQNASRDWFTNPENNGWAPNSPVTILRKGSENPLIDTGELRKSITYVVRDK